MHTAGKLGSQAPSKVLSIFDIYYSTTSRSTLLDKCTVSMFSPKQGWDICHHQAASNKASHSGSKEQDETAGALLLSASV